MAGNVDILRVAYQAFGGGDMEAVKETWEPDIEFVGPNSTRMPGAGIHRGKEEVGRLFSGMSERWEDLRFSPDEFVEQGETVVVLGQLEGRAKATGTGVRVPFVHIWRMRGGKAYRGQALTDTAVLADALAHLTPEFP